MATKTKSKPKATKPKTAKVNKTAKPKRPFVWYKTVWNSVRGKLKHPGESKVCRVGNHKVLLSKSSTQNSVGNCTHTASVIDKNGKILSTYKTDGGAHVATSGALKLAGIDVRKQKK